MTDINREYLIVQFELVEEYLRRAKGLAERSREDFLADPYAVDASIRELTVLFETCHNIAKHLIARHGWRAPSSKAEAFEILSEQRILSDDVVAAFREAARFRNLVTYQTAIIDDEVVYDILQHHLIDFERLLAGVAAWLAAMPEPSQG